jgi:glycosyltransferase involved in cell wall biosynthesis
MKILLVHQNLPGQFRTLIPRLARAPGVELLGIREAAPHAVADVGKLFPVLFYKQTPGAGKDTHHYLKPLEAATRRGQAVARICIGLRKKGWIPDVVLGHPGWGEMLFVKDVFPDSRLIGHFEYFYHGQGADVGFDPEFPSEFDDAFRLRLRNTTLLHSLLACDQGVAPTRWQFSRLPEGLRDKVQQIHEGIDTVRVRPDPAATFDLSGGLRLSRDDKVLTFVNRNLEPYRGFHVFMRALPELLKQAPDLQVCILGGDQVSYGSGPPAPFKSWRDKMWSEVGREIDASRVHFLGRLPYPDYLRLIQVSSLHVYLTYPFVLSWSMMEAMAAGCVVLGSNTPPVAELIRDGENGFLFDFFDQTTLVERAIDLLARRSELSDIRAAARRTIVDNYDFFAVTLPRWFDLIGLAPETP